ncbi:MAG: hypothetical protein NTV15_08820, partial [Candidatus Bathyarchaeota archaeon]|nr:hypothetical protein [Candidatus Bathyarchaeota archaeon]
MPNKRIVTVTAPGGDSTCFYNDEVPKSELVEVGVSTVDLEVAPTLYCVLEDGGYYNSVSVVINMLNDTTPVQRTLVWDSWSVIGGLHSIAVTDVNFDTVVDFTATYDGHCFYEEESCALSILKIQAKDAAGEFIEIDVEPPLTTITKYPCYFQEITTKSDLLYFGYGGVVVDNLYYLRSYEELETLDWIQIEGYTKEEGETTVNQDFQVFSLVRKIRTPGTSKVIAYDCFCKAGT